MSFLHLVDKLRSSSLNRRVVGPIWRRLRLAGSALRGDEAGLAAEAMNSQHMVVSFERNGLAWSVPTGDEIFTQMFLFGSYEQAELEAVLSFLGVHCGVDDTGTVIDVGANVGTTTIPLVLAGFDVLAVEPVPATFDLLEHNIARNGLTDRVVTVQAAIARGHTATMSVESAGRAEVVRPGFASDRPTIEVRSGGLLDLAVEAGVDPSTVRFVWADTQGCELHVVRTAGELWRRGVPLFAEVWPAALSESEELDLLIGALQQHFREFVTRDDLVEFGADARRRPIDEFGAFVRSINRYSDALFLPERT